MFVMLFLGTLGLIFIVIGLSFHLGYFRAPIIYWTTFSSGVYATAPLGAALIFLSLMTQYPYPHKIGVWLMSIAFGFFTVGIILGLTMPQFLTPRWFRFLRENYDDIMLILLKDAADNYSVWKKHTKTQEGLEAWAIGVRQKHNL